MGAVPYADHLSVLLHAPQGLAHARILGYVLTAVAIDPEVANFAEAVTGRLREVLGEDLHGAYLSGSVALGGYVPGQSDIDIIAVCQRPLEVSKKRAVAQTVSGEAVNCPTRGLEFVLYSRAAQAFEEDPLLKTVAAVVTPVTLVTAIRGSRGLLG